MRRTTALCAAAGIAVSALAAVPAQAGYYVIRWDKHRHLPDLERGSQVQADGMAVPLQGREQADPDLLCRDGCPAQDARAASLHAVTPRQRPAA